MRRGPWAGVPSAPGVILSVRLFDRGDAVLSSHRSAEEGRRGCAEAGLDITPEVFFHGASPAICRDCCARCPHRWR